MGKLTLSKEQIHDLVSTNRYPMTLKDKFLSRCIDGRYQNTDNSPPLAIPGADAGDLALILATANSFGFTVDKQKVLDTLVEVIGGVKNFQFHSDHHGDKDVPASGCGHLKQMNLDPAAYAMEKDQLDFITKSLITLKKQGAVEIILEGDHVEGAVLQVTGNYSVNPRFHWQTAEGRVETEVFVYHASLANERYCELARKLVENKAVELYPGTDIEYLYEVFQETAENHLFETIKRLAKGLPIYTVKFKEDGSFTVEEMERV